MPKKGYLSDDNGNPSSMRLMSVAALLFSGAAAYLTFSLMSIQGIDPDVAVLGIWIVAFFGTCAFAPKTLQKFIEVRGFMKNGNDMTSGNEGDQHAGR